MAEYLGALGTLVELDLSSTEATGRPDRYRLQEDAVGGVRASLRPVAPRSWSISAGFLSGRELAALEGFAEGEWGAGPWHWVSISAQHGNLLTPTESLCLAATTGPVSESGPMQCADGTWAGRSFTGAYSGTGWATVWTDIPVVPGRPVTFTADVTGDGNLAPQIALGFWSAGGSALTSAISPAGEASTGVVRTSVTATPPPGAASARVGIRSSVKRLTRPQVTWTSTAMPWSTGKGCRKAIPLGLTSGLLRSTGRTKSLSEATVTIQEIT